MAVPVPFDLADDVEVIEVDAVLERERWLELREQGIGGSDASAIIGVNQYASPLQVWLSKTHRRLGVPYGSDDAYLGAPSQAAYWGTKLEDAVASGFADHTGMDVIDLKAMLVQHGDHAPRVVNVDRCVYDVGVEAWVPLEIKTASAHIGSEWDDGPAGHAYTQVHHYDLTLRTGVAWICALIGGNDFRFMRVNIDRAFQDDLAAIENSFWSDYVVPLVEPPPEAPDVGLFTDARVRNEDEVELGDEARDLWDRAVGAHESIEAALEVLDVTKMRLKQMLGEHRVGTVSGQKLCGWSREPRRGKLYLPAEAQARLAEDHPDWWAANAVERQTSRRFTVVYDWQPPPDSALLS